MKAPREVIAEVFTDSHGKQRADGILAALDVAGYVIVPREPTEAMIEASNREWDGRMSHRSSGAWQAMIEAALTPPSE